MQCPAFAPHSSEVAVGFFWSFCILLSIICPNCARLQLFLVPYSFFAFCCLRSPDASTAAKGPRSQVPTCLKMTQKVFLVDTTTNAEQTGHRSVPTRLSRGPVVPSMPQYHMQRSHVESRHSPGKNRRRKAVMIRMAQTLYPKKSIFIRTCFVVEPIKLWTPILNPVILIKPVGIICLDTSQELMRSQLKT